QDAPRSFNKTPAMIKFFTEKIGYQYPFDKYAQTIVSDFTFGGMENTSATTLTEDTIHTADVHEDTPSDGLVAHELAHQWWGDLVTCRSWSHLWLNEGFATFFASLWKEQDQGRDEYLMEMIGHFHSYTDEEENLYRRPIVYNRYHEPDTLFDSTTYRKGALVLNMLRWQLGEKRFWKAMNHYARKFEYKNADTNDFKVAIEEVTGEDLEWFFDQWVYKAGYPEFVVDYHWDETAKLVRLQVKQTQTVDDLTPIFRTPVDVEIVTERGRQLHRIQVLGQEQEYHLPADLRPLMVRFDKTGVLIKKLKFNRPKDQILYQLQNDTEAWGRIEAARELKAYTSDETVIAALTRAASQDSFWGVRAEAANTLGSSNLPSALESLIAVYRDTNLKVRRSVIEALGNSRDERAFELLKRALETDSSISVVAAAAATLGKTGTPRAFELLTLALTRNSHQEIVRIGVFDGLKNLKDSRAVPLALQWAENGAPRRARTAAIRTLSALGKGREDVAAFLIGLLSDPVYSVRRASVEALKEVGETSALDPLNRRLNVEPDGRIRFAIREALQRLNEQKRARL
ncbi:MAG: M1 family aminopeptidase, partial [Acidobacteriota bacterium]